MKSVDIFVQNYFSLSRTAGFTEWMYILSNIFDVTIYSTIIFLCFVLLVYLLKGKKYSIFFTTTIVFTGVSVYFLKIFFDVARPLDGVMSVYGQSFPSYHATMSTVFFIILIYIFDDYFSSFIRWVFNFLCVFMIFAISFSRIYLGVHWVSDVVSGIVLGGIISYIAIEVFKKPKLL